MKKKNIYYKRKTKVIELTNKNTKKEKIVFNIMLKKVKKIKHRT